MMVRQVYRPAALTTRFSPPAKPSRWEVSACNASAHSPILDKRRPTSNSRRLLRRRWVQTSPETRSHQTTTVGVPGTGIGNKSFYRAGLIGQIYIKKYDLTAMYFHSADSAFLGTGTPANTPTSGRRAEADLERRAVRKPLHAQSAIDADQSRTSLCGCPSRLCRS